MTRRVLIAGATGGIGRLLTPALARDWIPGLAAAFGAPPPRTLPAWIARVAAGSDAVRAMTVQRGASNARIKDELGWRPRYPDWRAGFPTLVAG